ncbi:MAG: hypothetical protein Q4E76_03105 [Tissierellia bacterium]|nr:hypothetical protein [Tissierellia bacterium]
MTRSTADYYKELLPVFLVGALLPALFEFFSALAGTTFALSLTPEEMVTAGEIGYMALIQDKFFQGSAILSLVVTALRYVLSSLLNYGVIFAIYRKISFDTQVGAEDAFYFFSHFFGFALVVSIVSNILVGLGFLLLIIPGIILNMGLYPIAVWIAKAQTQEPMGVGETIKTTLDSTRGHKGYIFVQTVIFSIIVGVLGAAVGALVGRSALSVDGGIGLPGMIMALFLTFVGTMIIYIPAINIIRRLVDADIFHDRKGEMDDIDADLAALNE